MSLLSSIILPFLEKELVALEPEIAELILHQVQNVVGDLVVWIESKGKVAASSNPNANKQ